VLKKKAAEAALEFFMPTTNRLVYEAIEPGRAVNAIGV
jgi:hypothetical protein